MGNYLKSASKTYTEKIYGRKRKRVDSDNSKPNSDENNDDVLHTPKRKRIESTSKYIYQTLFLDGENSDIVIEAHGRNWNLHKLYLSQSPYFSCMFNGSWKESSQGKITIDIADPSINEEALKIAFGSLYKDYIFIKPVQVVSVLAAATLLQLEGLIEQCTSMMKDTVCSMTVVSYYQAAVRYGVDDVKDECFQWLLLNLLSNEYPDVLKEVSVELMCDLITSSDLYVMQVEMDIYTMLKKWIFLQLHTSWSGSGVDLDQESQNYFKQLVNTDEDSKKVFLASDVGAAYLPPFRVIRWQYLLTDLPALCILQKDRIISMDWIRAGYEYHWRQMLQLEQGQEVGPKECPDAEIFAKLSMRCGRILPKEGEYCWRWVGYNFGFDLIITYIHGLIILKRNTDSQACPHSVSLQTKRYIAYRLKTSSTDKNGKATKTKSSNLMHFCLGKDEEVVAMTVDNDMNFPLHISINVLLVTPPESGHPPFILDTDTQLSEPHI